MSFRVWRAVVVVTFESVESTAHGSSRRGGAVIVKMDLYYQASETDIHPMKHYRGLKE